MVPVNKILQPPGVDDRTVPIDDEVDVAIPEAISPEILNDNYKLRWPNPGRHLSTPPLKAIP